MHKSLIITLLSVVLTVPAFAQGLLTGAKLSPELLRVLQGNSAGLLSSGSGLVPHSSDFYMPRGLTYEQLSQKIFASLDEAQIPSTKEGRLAVAKDPQLLRRFQQEWGKPLFEGRPLSAEKTRTLVENYLKRFVRAREKGTYEAAWAEFIANEPPAPWRNGKHYAIADESDIDSHAEMIQEIYHFHEQYFRAENLIRARSIYNPAMEVVAVAVPVKGLTFEHVQGVVEKLDEQIEEEKFVIVCDFMGRAIAYPLDHFLERFRIIR